MHLQMMRLQEANFEHIVQDGLSEDDTLAQLDAYRAQYPLRVYSECDEGPYDAIARGFARANGEILGWLGADDYYLPWTLRTVECVFSAHPEIDWIIGMPAFGYGDGKVVKVNPLAPYYVQSLIRKGWYRPGCLGFIQQEAMFWRRRLWESVDGASVLRQFRYASDYFLWRSFAAKVELVTVASVFGVFVSRSQQISQARQADYFSEVGVSGKSTHASAMGKLFNRCAAICMSGRVIRPEQCIL